VLALLVPRLDAETGVVVVVFAAEVLRVDVGIESEPVLSTTKTVD